MQISKKREQIYARPLWWGNFQEVMDRIDDYIDYYNNDRYQTTLGGMSPNEFYHYTVTGKKPLALVV